MSITPTAEQRKALDLYLTGQDLILEAGAGCAKTSTLKFLAEATPGLHGQFTAFNKAIVTEAAETFPSNVTCSTIHSIAFRAYGKQFGRRLQGSKRLPAKQVARILGVSPFSAPTVAEPIYLSAGYLASHTLKALSNFCASDRTEPSTKDFPYIDGIDIPTPEGDRTYAANDLVRAHCLPALRKAWADAQNPQGQLRYEHAYYLKMFQLNDPQILGDFLFVDECQDMSPVMASIVLQQVGRMQVVMVGDEAQSIYGWMGAISAITRVREQNPGIATATLTTSFRFGPAIADVANGLLERAGHSLRLTGGAQWASVVGPIPEPTAVLCRTNATAVRRVLEEQDRGRKAALVGNGTEVLRFAEGAKALMAGEWTGHADLACFPDWAAVLTYVSDDPQGSDLALLVRLVEEFGCDTIIEALSRVVRGEDADVIISTTHKAKGLQWDSVQIADDFTPPKGGGESAAEELRLMYVAATRAKRELDLSLVPHFLAAPQPETDEETEDDMNAKALTLRYGVRQ